MEMECRGRHGTSGVAAASLRPGGMDSGAAAECHTPNLRTSGAAAASRGPGGMVSGAAAEYLTPNVRTSGAAAASQRPEGMTSGAAASHTSRGGSEDGRGYGAVRSTRGRESSPYRDDYRDRSPSVHIGGSSSTGIKDFAGSGGPRRDVPDIRRNPTLPTKSGDVTMMSFISDVPPCESPADNRGQATTTRGATQEDRILAMRLKEDEENTGKRQGLKQSETARLRGRNMVKPWPCESQDKRGRDAKSWRRLCAQ